MHELSLVMEVVKKVEAIAKSNEVTAVEEIVLQIGEISTVIPQFVMSCYPAAVDGTWLEETKLKIEKIKATAECRQCSKVYDPIDYHGICPDCGSKEHEILTGREFLIKEISCY